MDAPCRRYERENEKRTVAALGPQIQCTDVNILNTAYRARVVYVWTPDA